MVSPVLYVTMSILTVMAVAAAWTWAVMLWPFVSLGAWWAYVILGLAWASLVTLVAVGWAGLRERG